MKTWSTAVLVLALAAPALADEVEEFLSELDGKYYSLAGAGVTSIKVCVVPLGLKKEAPDFKAWFYWRAPDDFAMKVEGAPKDMAEVVPVMEKEGANDMKNVLGCDWSAWATEYEVTISDDGKLTKLEAKPREGTYDAGRDVSRVVLWFDGDLKLVKREREGEYGKARYEPAWKTVGDEALLLMESLKETTIDALGKETSPKTFTYAYTEKNGVWLMASEKDGGGIQEGKDETLFSNWELNPELDDALFEKR